MLLAISISRFIVAHFSPKSIQMVTEVEMITWYNTTGLFINGIAYGTVNSDM